MTSVTGWTRVRVSRHRRGDRPTNSAGKPGAWAVVPAMLAAAVLMASCSEATCTSRRRGSYSGPAGSVLNGFQIQSVPEPSGLALLLVATVFAGAAGQMAKTAASRP